MAISSTDRVRQAAAEAGLAIEIREMPSSTRTAEDAANACGCSVSEICKSLVFLGKTSGEIVLLLVSGSNCVDEAAVAQRIGEELGRADGRTVRERTGFAIGGVAPIGHLAPVKVYLDEDLTRFEGIWAAAGAPNAVFATTASDLLKATGATVIRMTP